MKWPTDQELQAIEAQVMALQVACEAAYPVLQYYDNHPGFFLRRQIVSEALELVQKALSNEAYEALLRERYLK